MILTISTNLFQRQVPIMTLYHHHSSTVPSNSGNNKDDIATPKIPRGLRGLPMASVSADYDGMSKNQLEQEARTIEQWWSEPRWKYTKRGYNGMFYALTWLYLISLKKLAYSK